MREILIVFVLLTGVLMETRGQHGPGHAAQTEAHPRAGVLGAESPL